MVIDHELKNVIRSHHDITTDNTPHMKKAIRVSKQLVCFCVIGILLNLILFC